MKKFILKMVLILSIFLMILLCTTNIVNGNDIEKNISGIKTENIQSSIQTIIETNLKSEGYLISELYSYIGRILPRTTIEQFKLTFNVQATNIHVYKDDTLTSEINFGYIGTNMVVKFDGIDKLYTISVVGDFNGDGLANQIELGYLIKHIIKLEGQELTGMKLLSADINKDGDVNQIDLSILINYIVYGKLNIGEINIPKSPTIKVISGKQTTEGFYLTNVIVQIKPNETENVEKTTYIIEGPTNTEETQMPKDGKINLQEDGIYKIISYTYSKDGARSQAAELIVKKYTKQIQEESVNLELRLENEEGELYTQDTWTNKSVYIKPIQMTEKLDSNTTATITTTYTITGDLTITTAQKDSMLIENEGQYLITAVATDNLGRRKVKEYNVKIDKTNPEASSITINEEKLDSEYYNEKVKPIITYGQDALSGIKTVTYKLEYSKEQEVSENPEIEIENGGIVQLTEEGTTKLIVKTYDNAGNITTKEQIIKIDTEAPIEITLVASDITGTSYKLTATAKDVTSGILKYNFYIDGNFYERVETSEEEATIEVTKQPSGEHNVQVVVIDNAENSGTSETTVVETAKLINDEIDYIEFKIEGLDIKNDTAPVNESQVQGIISDTSLTTESKYMQITITQNGTSGEIYGKMIIVRKDGEIVEDLKYFPEELTIQVGHLSNGSGNQWQHDTKVQILEEDVFNGQGINEATELKQVSYKIKTELEKNHQNKFNMLEKKISGVNSYTRFSIESITINEEKLPFKINKNNVINIEAY